MSGTNFYHNNLSIFLLKTGGHFIANLFRFEFIIMSHLFITDLNLNLLKLKKVLQTVIYIDSF